MELPCFQHSSSLSHPGIFGQLSQVCAVLFLSQILFPWHVLLPSTESQPVLQITCIDPKTFVREQLPYLLHSLERDVPSSAGRQDKLSALETEIGCGLIFPCYGLTMQTDRSLRATRLAWSLASLSDNSWGFQQRLACNQVLGEHPDAELKQKPGAWFRALHDQVGLRIVKITILLLGTSSAVWARHGHQAAFWASQAFKLLKQARVKRHKYPRFFFLFPEFENEPITLMEIVGSDIKSCATVNYWGVFKDNS